MSEYYSGIRKYAVTLGLTTGILWLTGGLLGVYFSKGDTLLFLSALLVGGLPIAITLLAAKYNVLGALLLILEAVSVLVIIYSEVSNLIIIIVLCLSYSIPIVLSGVNFIRYWYKNKTRI